MSKVLKITKPDKTVHTSPLHNRAFYQSYNNRLPADQRWKIEEIDESEIAKLPFRDENHVTGSEAVQKLQEKDAEIEALKKKLAEMESGEAKTGGTADASDTTNQGTPPKPTAKDVIALISAATTVEQVENLAKDDERVSVKEAAAKKIAALKG